jgi:hypothetical protein
MDRSKDVGRSGHRVKATPAGVAASLAETVIESANALRTRLDEQGFSNSEPKRFNSDACVLECVLFEWFLRDLVIATEFGRHANPMSNALAERLLIELRGSSLSPACLSNFDELHHQRFGEYTQALKATSSLQALGALAWLRIVGSEKPSDRMTMLLASRATAELSALRGLATRYTIIGPLAPWLGAPLQR